MTQTDKVLSRKDGNVAHIVFNNPERRNAMSLEMWEACTRLMATYAKDPDVRVVVLSGAGDKAFIAGADISKFGEERASDAGVKKYNDAVESAYASVHEFPKPTIAMIRGFCVGGGMGLASCADLRICSEDAQFGIPAAKLSIGYGAESLAQLIELVGPSHAKEILFTARRYPANEAHRIGLVNHVCQASMLESFVNSYAETMAGNAPLSIIAAKRVIDEYVKDPANRNQKLADDAVAACFVSEDYKEGRKAFMEKRKPVWTGK